MASLAACALPGRTGRLALPGRESMVSDGPLPGLSTDRPRADVGRLGGFGPRLLWRGDAAREADTARAAEPTGKCRGDAML